MISFFTSKKRKNNSTPPVVDNADSISSKEYCNLQDTERTQWNPVPIKYERIPLLCVISLIVFILCAVIYAIACINQQFADAFNLYVSSCFRFMLAKLTNILPFSLAELFIILLPIIAFLAIWYLVKYRCDTKKASIVSIVCILSVIAMLLSCFVLCFSTGYKGRSLDKKLDLQAEAVSPEELYLTASYLAEKVNALSANIIFTDDGSSVMPYDFDEMNEKLLTAYKSYCNDKDFIYTYSTKLKPVLLSEAMSYTHITGVYSFFTGEANINVAFPDYTIPYTAAHELAHQRGIAREDEANMIAFLVCMESDDPYIQYSAYLNVYEYVASALYRADKKLYSKAREILPITVIEEQRAYNRFFDKYEKSVASQVSGAVNDAYLKAQGTVGKKSYGMVVDLTVAYFKKQGFIVNN